MVLDTSALVAIALETPQASRLRHAVLRHAVRVVSAVSLLETLSVLLVRHGDAASGLVDLLMQELRLDVVPVDMTQLAIGLDAAIRYGVGRHAASLDVGDCSAYALAMMRGEPLLFVGDAFTRTDVTAVAW